MSLREPEPELDYTFSTSLAFLNLPYLVILMISSIRQTVLVTDTCNYWICMKKTEQVVSYLLSVSGYVPFFYKAMLYPIP